MYVLIVLALFLSDVTATENCTLADLDANVANCTNEEGFPIAHNEITVVSNASFCEVSCFGKGIPGTAFCINGKWSITPYSCSDDLEDSLRREKRSFTGIFIAIVVGAISLFGGRSGPAPDRSAPAVYCPPKIHRYADPFQINTRIYWDESVAYAVDNRDGRINAHRWSRKGPNYVFEGVTDVYYHARDRAGNSGFCNMIITVEVIRCSRPNPTFQNGYYTCHPSSDFVYGTTCYYGCYYGHEIHGKKRRECLKDGTWSSVEPRCEAVTCPSLDPVVDGIFECSDVFNFKSACTYTCKAGFDVKQGQSRVRVCAFDGKWRGQIPKCTDSEPPKFIDCPRVLTYFNVRNSSEGLVSWAVPTASDNSGTSITVTQTSGIENNAYHEVGLYDIIYDAVDEALNKARQCKFKVVVRELKCFAQHPLPYMKVICPNGYKYGAQCDFSCQFGYTLDGSSRSECEKSTTNPPYSYWQISEQPTCQAESSCPTLDPPDNGALVCDLWANGELCQMQCMKGTDIGPDFNSWKLFVCLNSGKWDFDGDIPACVETIGALKTRMTADIYYYDGRCTDDAVMRNIKENFLNVPKLINFIQASGFTDLTIENVKVTCGAVREKRGTNNTNRVHIHLEIVATMNETQSESAFKDAETESYELLQAVKDDLKGNNSKLLDIPESSRSGLEVINSQVDLDCPKGTLPAYTSMSCVGCSPGTYFTEDHICEPCPVGFYQPDSGQLQCLECPKETTTLQTNTKRYGDCLSLCPMGHFSASGVEPCTPCDIAEYSDQIGSFTCKKCPVSMTTMQQAATEQEFCKHFDINLITGETSKVELNLSPLTFDLKTGFKLRLWLMMSASGDVLSLESSGAMLFSLRATEDLNLQFSTERSSQSLEPSLERDKWYQVLLAYDSSSLTIYVGSTKVFEDMWSEPGWSTVSSMSVVIGGSGMEGSISQLNIWSNGTQDKQPVELSCFSEDVGDVVAWDMFTTSNLTDSFLQIPSVCDDTNNCDSNPCQFGSCNDVLNGYMCDCNDGYKGVNCEVNIDDCPDNLCTNGATCVDGIMSYTCMCTANYTGQYCDSNLVHGNWGTWGNWSVCSTTCGPGERRRVRLCDNPLPQNGGASCIGPEDETGVCNDQLCPVCSKLQPPSNGILDCQEKKGLQLCNITCNDGYEFDQEPLTEYKCGAETGYTWNHNTTDNPNRYLPNCMPIDPASTLEVQYSASYAEMQCESGNKDIVGNRVQGEIDRLPCIKDHTCYVRRIDINTCDNFAITISSDPITAGTQESLVALIGAIHQLNSTAAAGNFTVTIDSVDYHLISVPDITGHVKCPNGWANVDYYCVPCGPGTYHINGYCELCDAGRYNNKTAASSCEPCPEGTSTPGRGARGPDECTVEVPLDSWTVTIVLCCVLIPLAGVAVAAAVCFFCKWKRIKTDVPVKSETQDINGIVKESKKKILYQPSVAEDLFEQRPQSRTSVTGIDIIDSNTVQFLLWNDSIENEIN